MTSPIHRWLRSLSVFFCVLSLLVLLVDSLTSFEAHRAIQFDKFVEPFGSRLTKVDNVIAPLKGDHDLGRHVAVIHARDITVDSLASIKSRRGTAVVIVLPSNVTELTESQRKEFHLVEEYILNTAIDSAVYFAFENSILREMVESSEKHGSPKWSSLESTYHLTGDEQSEVLGSYYDYRNIFGILKGAESDGIILVASNYDSFGAVPTVSFGSSESGTGIATIIALLQTFSGVYGSSLMADKGLSEKYAVVFALTAGGYNNFEGTMRLLNSNDAWDKRSVVLALFLDSLALGDSLTIHGNPAFSMGYDCERFQKSLRQLESHSSSDSDHFDDSEDSSSSLDEDSHENDSFSSMNTDSTNTASKRGRSRDSFEKLNRLRQVYSECVAQKDGWNARVNHALYLLAQRTGPVPSSSPSSSSKSSSSSDESKDDYSFQSRQPIKLSTVTTAVKTDTNVNSWHHWTAAREGIPATATLSGRRSSKRSLIKSASILDRLEMISETSLFNRIRFLTDVLFVLIYDLPLNEQTLSETLDVARQRGLLDIDESYVRSYLALLSSMPRVGAFDHGSPSLKKIRSDFNRLSHKSFVQKYRPKNSHEKYYSTGVKPKNLKEFLDMFGEEE